MMAGASALGSMFGSKSAGGPTSAEGGESTGTLDVGRGDWVVSFGGNASTAQGLQPWLIAGVILAGLVALKIWKA